MLEIEPGRPVVVGSHFQRATESGFGAVKIPPLKRLERLGKGFAPGPGRFRLIAQADQFVNLDGLLEAFEPKTAGEAGGDFPAGSLLGLARDENVGAEIFIQAFHARSQVHVLTQRRVVDPRGAAEIAHIRQPGVDADAGPQFQAALFSGEFHVLVVEEDGRAAGQLAMIGLLVGRVPHGEDGVADELDDSAFGLVDARDGGFEILVHDPGQVVGVHPLGKFGEVFDVREHDAEHLLHGARFQQFGPPHKLLDASAWQMERERMFQQTLLDVELNRVEEHRPKPGKENLSDHDQPGKPEARMDEQKVGANPDSDHGGKGR